MGELSATMSTAGAAAVCRTVTRAVPAPSGDWSLAKTVILGLPDALRWATTDLLWFSRR